MDFKLVLTGLMGIGLGLVLGGIFEPSNVMEDLANKNVIKHDDKVTSVPIKATKLLDKKTKNVDDLDAYRHKISTLEEQIFELKLTVARANREKQRALDSERLLISGRQSEKFPQTVAYSKEEIDYMMPEPFASTVIALDGDFAQQFNAFKREVLTDSLGQPVDELSAPEASAQWQYQMEALITDSIGLHELSSQIRIESVTCRVNGCEIRGFQDKRYIWTEVLMSLQQADWWSFHQSYGTSNETKVHGQYFYALLSN